MSIGYEIFRHIRKEGIFMAIYKMWDHGRDTDREERSMKVMFAPAHRLGPEAPPHVRRRMFRIEFDEADQAAFQSVFGDEDTAAAAMNILFNAPPEIQVLALQLLHTIEEV